MVQLTEPQKYLQGLRDGNPDASLLEQKPQVTTKALDSFANFEQFLHDHGHPNPQSDDLYLQVDRSQFLSILYYADDRDRRCLILQSCFGFDQEPVIDTIEPNDVPPHIPIKVLRRVGRVVLVNKGNFQQLDGRSDDDFFKKDADTVYRNGSGNQEFYLNMDINRPLVEKQANEYTDNFAKMYIGRSLDHNPFIQGFLLPTKALIRLFTDVSSPWVNADQVTFRWGLTTYNDISGPGNFTLTIGTGDATTGPSIEFRTDQVKVADDNDCPPHSGCPRPRVG